MKKILFTFLFICVVVYPVVSSASLGGEISSILDRLVGLVGRLKQMASVGATTVNQADFTVNNVIETAPELPNFLSMLVCNKGTKSLAEMGASLNLEVSAGPWDNKKQTKVLSSTNSVVKDIKNGACATVTFKVTDSELIALANKSNQYYVNFVPSGNNFVDTELQDNSWSFVRSGGVYISRVINKTVAGKEFFRVSVCNDAPKALSETQASAPFYMVFSTGDQFDGFDMGNVDANGSVTSSKGLLTNVGGGKLANLGFAPNIAKSCNDYMYLPSANSIKTAFSDSKRMGVMMYPKSSYVEPTLFDNIYLFNKNTGEKGAVVSNKIAGYDFLSPSNKRTFLESITLALVRSNNLTGNTADTGDNSIILNSDENYDLYWIVKIAEELRATASASKQLAGVALPLPPLPAPVSNAMDQVSTKCVDEVKNITNDIGDKLKRSKGFKIIATPNPMPSSSDPAGAALGFARLDHVTKYDAKLDKDSNGNLASCEGRQDIAFCKYNEFCWNPKVPGADMPNNPSVKPSDQRLDKGIDAIKAVTQDYAISLIPDGASWVCKVTLGETVQIKTGLKKKLGSITGEGTLCEKSTEGPNGIVSGKSKALGDYNLLMEKLKGPLHRLESTQVWYWELNTVGFSD